MKNFARHSDFLYIAKMKNFARHSARSQVIHTWSLELQVCIA